METQQNIQAKEQESKSWPKVAIIILNWNGWRDTVECLESVEKLTYPNYKVILVDNGSVDDSVTQICQWVMGRPEHWGKAYEQTNPFEHSLPPGAQVALETDKLTLIRSEENRGFTGGCNLAIDYALARDPSYEFFFLLNNDAKVEPKCLTICVTTAERKGAAITGALIRYLGSSEIIAAGTRFPLELFRALRFRHSNNTADSWFADAVAGAAMLIRRDIIERRKRELGYFLDPSLFMYGEDLELCVWSKRKGFSIVVAASAIVEHRLTSSSGGRGSALSYYYCTRNRVHLARRLLSPWLRILFHLWYPPSRLIRVLQMVLQGKPELAKAIAEGLIDGYRKVYGKWVHHSAS